jgi:hypothetical protein
MWELVEYLSSQRSAVNFTYEAEYFTVTFLHLGAAAAQRLLDVWNPSACARSQDMPRETFDVAAMAR